MHLIDHGKKYIEKNYERSFFDKLIRYFLSITLPNTKVFKLSSFLVKLSKPFKGRIIYIKRTDTNLIFSNG